MLISLAAAFRTRSRKAAFLSCSDDALVAMLVLVVDRDVSRTVLEASFDDVPCAGAVSAAAPSASCVAVRVAAEDKLRGCGASLRHCGSATWRGRVRQLRRAGLTARRVTAG